MQEPFEFNAPKTYNFLVPSRHRHPSDCSINLADPNDYWFMITHVEVSPSKKQDDDSAENTQNQPIRRPQVQQKQAKAQIQQEKQTQNQPQIKKRKTARKTLPPKPFIKPNIFHNKDRKTITTGNQKLNQNMNNNHLLLEKKMRHGNNNQANIQKTDDSLKESKIRNKSMGFLSKSRKDQSKDSRPCPFPPRIQRQWQKGSKKDWYNLSPQSKIEAEKKMGQIKHSKQFKGFDNKKKQKKEQGRFKF